MHRLLALTVVATGLVAAGSPAQAAAACTYVQVTQTTGLSDSNRGPSISDDGTRVTWRSNRDIVPGQNTDLSQEIFLWDATPTPTITQITAGVGGGADEPAISGDGTRIAYRSNQDLGDNPDLSGEIFLYDVAAATSTQLSDRNGFLTRTPSIDADGTRVTWRDSSDGNSEIYLHDTTTHTTTQVTSLPSGFSQLPTISADGTRIAFESSANFGGTNPEGTTEIHLHDTTTHTTSPITSSPTVSSTGPVISGSGTRIAFAGAGGGVIHDTTTGTDTVVAHGFGPGATTGFARSINGDGTRIAFDSSGDVDPAPPVNHNHEIWLYQPGGTVAVTDNTESNHDPDITADGTRIAFHSDGDLVAGQNTDANPEIFVATCAPPPRPDAQIALAAAGPFAGNDRYAAGVTPAQTRSGGVARGASRTFHVRAQNDAAVASSLKVKGASSGGSGFTVTYFRGTTNISAQVRAGTYTLSGMAPGSSVVLKVRITAGNATRRGAVHNADVTVRSAASAAVKDTVRARVTRT